MSEGILNLEQMKEQSHRILEIPGFETGETVKVKVQKPRLLSLARQGKIPNHLIDIANDMLMGGAPSGKEEGTDGKLKVMSDMMELYCRACLVEPTYEEFAPYMTDRQGDAIFKYAMDMVSSLDSFREDREDDTDNSDGEKVQGKAK